MATSRLSDVMREVQAVFSVIGDATPVMIGKQYLERGIGAGPRVVFAPHPAGKWGAVNELNSGHVGGIASSCNVYIRGAETGDDATRFDAAEILAERVMTALRWAGAGGRIEGGEFSDDSPVSVDAYGADIALSFTYYRGAPIDTAVRDAYRKGLITPGASPPDRDRPNGGNGNTYQQTVTTDNERP